MADKQSDWQWNVFLIVSAADQAAAEAVCAAVWPDTGGAQTMTLPLSPTGTMPATNFGGIVPATDQLSAGLLTALQGASIGSLVWYVVNCISGGLAASSSPTATDIGFDWNWPACLTDTGLIQIVPGGTI